MEIRETLPVHPMPRDRAGLTPKPSLRIDGLTSRAIDVGRAALAVLPRRALAQPFRCEEGWTVPRVRWGGVSLADAIALAGPLPSARYVRVHAGEYVVPVPLVDAADTLLCDEMDGCALTPAHGAPWRLVGLGGACFASVKWVDRLEMTAEAGERTGERIARSRLEARARPRPQPARERRAPRGRGRRHRDG